MEVPERKLTFLERLTQTKKIPKSPQPPPPRQIVIAPDIDEIYNRPSLDNGKDEIKEPASELEDDMNLNSSLNEDIPNTQALNEQMETEYTDAVELVFKKSKEEQIQRVNEMNEIIIEEDKQRALKLKNDITEWNNLIKADKEKKKKQKTKSSVRHKRKVFRDLNSLITGGSTKKYTRLASVGRTEDLIKKALPLLCQTFLNGIISKAMIIKDRSKTLEPWHIIEACRLRGIHLYLDTNKVGSYHTESKIAKAKRMNKQI